MIPTVPELPADIRELKARVAAFLEAEVYPLEQRVAEAGHIDPEWVNELRRKSWAEGFGMLNMPEEAGGRGLSMLAQVALEEESGKATNGLGFVVVDRGPAELWDIATPAQREQFVGAGPARRVPRGLGGHRARRRLRRQRPRGHGRAGRGRVGAERREVVRDERGRPGLLPRARGRRRRAGALHRRAVAARPRDHEDARASCTTRTSTTTPRSSLTNCRVPEENRIPEGGGDGAREWFLVERLFIAARCCGAATRSLELARDFALEREAFGAKIAEHQGVSFQLADSLTELLAARLLTYHAAQAFDSEPDRRVVHGKVAMAKLYASEAAGRIVDRALQVLGGRGYMLESPVARFYREVRVDRIWEGTSEIQRLIVSRGLLKRGVETYLR